MKLRNVGFEDSVRYGIFRIAGTAASGPLPVQISALGTLGYRMGAGLGRLVGGGEARQNPRRAGRAGGSATCHLARLWATARASEAQVSAL